MQISVNISVWETVRLDFEAMALQKLRAAGIPVKGVILYSGIEEGVLARYEELDGSYTFLWRDGEAS